MESDSQVIKVSAMLRTPSDWQTWIIQIRKVAVKFGVWGYIDPTLDTQPEEPDH